MSDIIWIKPFGQALVNDVALLTKISGEYAPKAIVTEASANVRKVFTDKYLQGTYRWRGNPGGQLSYTGAGKARYPKRVWRMWSSHVFINPHGILMGGPNEPKRLIGYALDKRTVPGRRTATFYSLPMNLWENDVHYTKGSFGPWKKGMTRPGIHWLRKSRGEVLKVGPESIEMALERTKILFARHQRPQEG